jgi:hypothetical protein
MTAISLDTLVSQVNVSGMNTRTIANVPENLEALNCPILFPNRDKWFQGSESVPGVWDSPVGLPVQNDRNLQYTFLYYQAGEGRGLADFAASATIMLETLSDSLMRLDMHMNRITKVTISPLRNIALFGKTFVGADVIVQAREMSVSV